MDTTFWSITFPVIISAGSALATFLVFVFKGGVFYNRMGNIENKIDKIESRIDKVDEKIDRVDDKVDEKIGQVNERIYKIESRIDRLDDKVDYRIGSLENRMTVLEFKHEKTETRLERIEESIGKILDCLKVSASEENKEFELNKENITLQRCSPRSLSDLGRKLFAEMKGEAFLQQNKNRLFAFIDEQDPLTALDVEEYAYKAILSLSKSPVMNNIKNFVYNCPLQRGKDQDGIERTMDINLYKACLILAIPLRDKYLEQHPELNVTNC